MIGLVNATGATDALHREVVRKTGERAEQATPEQTPVLSNEQAANRVLRGAVESIRLQSQGPQRGAPAGDGSDRFQQADSEAAATPGPLGRSLDVTA